MKGRTLVVRNFLGIRKADLPLEGIVLVAGRNGAGKSSLIEAAICALAQDAAARGVNTKVGSAQLVHRGAEAGSINVMQDGARMYSIGYPGGEIEQFGAPVPPVSRIALGVAQLVPMRASERTRLFSDHLGALPSLDDLTKFLAAQEALRPWLETPVDGDDGPTLLHKAARKLYARVEVNGWDAVDKEVREEVSKRRGAWEQITNERFGTKKAADWRPPILIQGEDHDVETAAARVAAARGKLEQLLQAKGVNDGEAATLRNAVAVGEQAVATRSKIDDQIGKNTKRVAELVAQQAAPGAPINFEKLIRCPKCSAFIREVIAGTVGGAGPAAYRTFEAVDAPPHETEREAQAAAANKISSDIKMIEDANARLSAEGAALRQRIADGEAAKRQLAASEGSPERDMDAIATQRNALGEVERYAEAVRAVGQAAKVLEDYTRLSATALATGPDGVRAAILRRKMAEFNQEVSGLCQAAGFAPVEIADDYSITYDGILAQLCSRSERWRVEVVLAVAFAKQEGQFVLIDELDVLVQDARPGVLQMLKAAGVGGMIATTAKDRSGVPDLGKIGIGHTYWVEKGELSPL